MDDIITSHATHPVTDEATDLNGYWTALVLLVLAVMAGATLYGLFCIGRALVELVLTLFA